MDWTVLSYKKLQGSALHLHTGCDVEGNKAIFLFFMDFLLCLLNRTSGILICHFCFTHSMIFLNVKISGKRPTKGN